VSNSQHSVPSDAARRPVELAFGQRHWGGLLRISAADAPSVCGQPHGRRLHRCSPLVSYQCNRCAFALATNAGLERGTDAPAFPGLGGLGGLRCSPGNYQSGPTRRRRILLRSRAGAQSARSFGGTNVLLSWGGFAGMRLLALELDREDTVSLGRAAELCQTPLAAFMDFAVKHRVPHSGAALRTSNKNPRLLTVSNPGRRNWSPLSC
jgi:hypothetical protein